MLFAKIQSVLLALAAARSVFAHTTFTTFYVDGVDQGPGVAMRMNKTPANASFPVQNLASSDMACGFDGTEGVARVQPVKDGSTLTFEFHSWANDYSKPSLDPGHKGPCAVYLKKVNSAINDTGVGDGWFKLWDDGYDEVNDEWCTDRMISNNGRMSIVLPSDLQGGYYLVRPELVALHNATKGDPQFYIGCAQIFLQSSGNLEPESTVSIPGYVKAGEESVSFNIYYNPDNKTYPVPGPAVAKLKAGAATTQKTQDEGLKPAGCILEKANWCGYEVPSYTDEAGCWASAKNCWAQDTTCWTPYSPTGGANCEIWETKCNGLNDACNAKQFTGPPNKGKDLTPTYTTIAIGLVLPTSTVAGAASSFSSQAVVAAAGVSGGGGSSGVVYSTPAGKATGAVGGYAASSSPVPTEKPGLEVTTVFETVVKTEWEYVTVYQSQGQGQKVRRGRRGGARR
ncbi:lytic polysaccharide monooxygenase [Glonium stellatum]|uniref:AA9 family lytic polysaccharide monooxygenase n=1 Tax=Glonium stellatum TaxID=574774 RepID=A0A8E2JN02_9PEZI|nr:lytic polysaccharide monooxygenase [Glonium stellatum]